MWSFSSSIWKGWSRSTTRLIWKDEITLADGQLRATSSWPATGLSCGSLRCMLIDTGLAKLGSGGTSSTNRISSAHNASMGGGSMKSFQAHTNTRDSGRLKGRISPGQWICTPDSSCLNQIIIKAFEYFLKTDDRIERDIFSMEKRWREVGIEHRE